MSGMQWMDGLKKQCNEGYIYDNEKSLDFKLVTCVENRSTGRMVRLYRGLNHSRIYVIY